MILNKISSVSDGIRIGSANNSLDKLRSRTSRNIGRTDVNSAAQHENLGVKVGHSVNSDSTLYELD
jgi:hypothetical protein